MPKVFPLNAFNNPLALSNETVSTARQEPQVTQQLVLSGGFQSVDIKQIFTVDCQDELNQAAKKALLESSSIKPLKF